ncbi:hypothetical protein Ahy_A07g032773 [Arachis hypogaea]|uniref:Pentatricopeptide repeat-containing protein n=1 Tax=Arachis hypogaea TaxID=3818 RepID=A0A445C7M9_ARAHY|nr:hypothetical protein Ahy_A07g032773 [Arachis hypogaea]
MRLFVEINRNGCDVDAIIYTTLIMKKVERGYELLDQMIQQGLVPNQLTYHLLMLAHKKKEELEEYIELVNEMHKICCTPDLNIYNTVIRLGEIKEGARLWNEMEASGIRLGINTFLMMINGFLNQASCEHFKEMVDKGIFTSPQYGTLNELMNSLLRAQKLELTNDT